MKKLNLAEIAEESWSSPKGKFAGFGKEISFALGHNPNSGNFNERHPFDIEICRVPPGKMPCPFHSHSAQFEYYQVLSGSGLVRHAEGTDGIVPGDVFIFPPGEPHQVINNSSDDLILLVVADNPAGESCFYPDSNKWMVRSPKREMVRATGADYNQGEE
jgi:uncharacterized cupin superfamily protein